MRPINGINSENVGFSALNPNAPLAMTFAPGPTFGYVTNALPPPFARFGVRFRF
jgi:hypothetical protein